MSLVSQPALRQAQARTTYVLLLSFNIYFSDFYRTGLHEICRICRTLAVDERSGVIFFDPSRDVAVATNFVGKVDVQSTPCSSHHIR